MKTQIFAVAFGLLLLTLECASNTGSNIEGASRPDTQDPSCLVQVPPPEAGERVLNRTLVKVYPRRSNLSPSFNGCQSVWQEAPGGWPIAYRLHIQNGSVTKISTPTYECAYVGASLDANALAVCPKAVPQPQGSLPPGCLTATLFRDRSDYPCLPDDTTPFTPAILTVNPNSRPLGVSHPDCEVDAITLVGIAAQQAILRCEGKSAYLARLNSFVGRSRAKIIHIGDATITLQNADGVETELKVSNSPRTSDRTPPAR
jgi:hypothetical protein